MGLAVLPARLKGELSALADAILAGSDLRADPTLAKHADWVDEWLENYSSVTSSNINEIIRKEVGIVFSHVLEDAGVYKCTDEGRAAMMRFLGTVLKIGTDISRSSMQ